MEYMNNSIYGLTQKRLYYESIWLKIGSVWQIMMEVSCIEFQQYMWNGLWAVWKSLCIALHKQSFTVNQYSWKLNCVIFWWKSPALKPFMEYTERTIYGLYKPSSGVDQYGWKSEWQVLVKISHIKFYENPSNTSDTDTRWQTDRHDLHIRCFFLTFWRTTTSISSKVVDLSDVSTLSPIFCTINNFLYTW
jgi:hypothetical protein